MKGFGIKRSNGKYMAITCCSDVLMSAMAHQMTGASFFYSTVCSVAEHRKHQSFASLAFVRGMHQWLLNCPHKGSITRKMFPFDNVIMSVLYFPTLWSLTRMRDKVNMSVIYFTNDLWTHNPKPLKTYLAVNYKTTIQSALSFAHGTTGNLWPDCILRIMIRGNAIFEIFSSWAQKPLVKLMPDLTRGSQAGSPAM